MQKLALTDRHVQNFALNNIKKTNYSTWRICLNTCTPFFLLLFFFSFFLQYITLSLSLEHYSYNTLEASEQKLSRERDECEATVLVCEHRFGSQH